MACRNGSHIFFWLTEASVEMMPKLSSLGACALGACALGACALAVRPDAVSATAVTVHARSVRNMCCLPVEKVSNAQFATVVDGAAGPSTGRDRRQPLRNRMLRNRVGGTHRCARGCARGGAQRDAGLIECGQEQIAALGAVDAVQQF